MTVTTTARSAETSEAVVFDPTQGVRELAAPVAERDPTAGAPNGMLDDPTSPGRTHARTTAGPVSHAPSPYSDHKPLGHVAGHAIGEHLPRLRRDRSLGRVVGHAVGEALPRLRPDRPVGHVVGYAPGDAPEPTRSLRPVGHVVGRSTSLSTRGIAG
jgi:hypothetical protein